MPARISIARKARCRELFLALVVAMRGFGALATFRVNCFLKDWIADRTHIVANLSGMAGNRLKQLNIVRGESL
jgi:hypothetical protein